MIPFTKPSFYSNHLYIAGIAKRQVNDLTNDIFGESGSSGGKSTDPADLEKARKEEKKKWVDVHVTVSVHNIKSINLKCR